MVRLAAALTRDGQLLPGQLVHAEPKFPELAPQGFQPVAVCGTLALLTQVSCVRCLGNRLCFGEWAGFSL